MMLDYDPKLPNAISKMLPVILGYIRPQLRQCHEPALSFGLVAFAHFARIVAGLTAPTACAVEDYLVIQAFISIADTLYSSRPNADCYGVPEGA